MGGQGGGSQWWWSWSVLALNTSQCRATLYTDSSAPHPLGVWHWSCLMTRWVLDSAQSSCAASSLVSSSSSITQHFRSTSQWDAASSTRNCRRTDCPGSGCSVANVSCVWPCPAADSDMTHTDKTMLRSQWNRMVYLGRRDWNGGVGVGGCHDGNPSKPRRQFVATPLFT